MPYPIRLGLLSTARVNNHVIDAARSSTLFRVGAVASRERVRAEAYARAHGLDRAHGSYEALLEDRELDAVYISLPNALHVEWTLRALQAGKHVLCEKPLTWCAADAEQAFNVAASTRRVLTEGFMYRHHPQTPRLRQLVGEGAIGALLSVRAFFTYDALARHGAADIRFETGLNGGALMDLGCYCVNIMRFVSGEPASVTGEALLASSGVDASFHGLLQLRDDAMGEFRCSFGLPLRQKLEIVGDRGAIRVEAPWLTGFGGRMTLIRGESVQIFDAEQVDAYKLQLENFSRATRGEVEILLGRRDGVSQALVMEALRRSALEQRSIDVN